MATSATISSFLFQLGDGASPQVYSTIEEVLSITGVGVQNELIDVTNFDSPNSSKEYISGLGDGAEITVECNFVSGTQQLALMADVDAGNTENFQLLNQNTSPNEKYQFDAVCKGWTIEPSATEQNRIIFTLKISGDIQ